MSFWILLLEVLLIGVSLSMDAFAVSISDGLTYSNLSKRRGAFIPATFAVFQAVMPLIGYFIAFGVGKAFQTVFDAIDHWIAFALLFLIGAKMIIDAIKELRSKEENLNHKQFSFAEVLLQGVATSIDALFVGVSFAATEGLKDSIPNVFISVAIIGLVTLIITAIGLFIGIKVGNIFKNKSAVTEIIGGSVLIIIGIKILLNGYGLLPF